MLGRGSDSHYNPISLLPFSPFAFVNHLCHGILRFMINCTEDEFKLLILRHASFYTANLYIS